jgi:hypothetical protein
MFAVKYCTRLKSTQLGILIVIVSFVSYIYQEDLVLESSILYIFSIVKGGSPLKRTIFHSSI